jgi:hypothetical protein
VTGPGSTHCEGGDSLFRPTNPAKKLMTLRSKAVLLLITLGVAFAPSAVAPSAMAQVSDVETTKATAQDVYIYGFPLVMNYKVFHDSFLDPTSKGYKGPLNQIHNEAQVYTPANRVVQTPNSDTPYSMLGADLRAEPLVLCVPKVGEGRYFSVQMVDMYTHNYGYLGTRTTGNDGGCFLLAGPGWKGEKPAGVKEIFHCESPFSLLIFRTQLLDAGDIENVRKIQAGYKVQTLSAFLKQPAPPAKPEIQWPTAPQEIFSTGFPAMLDYLLAYLPPVGPAAGEKELRERFATLGIGPGAKVKFRDLPPDQKAAFGDGVKAALAKIDYAVNNLGEEINGWRIGGAAGSREFYNGNWLLRAAGSRAGIYGNDAAEATYPFAKLDQNGNPLDGSRHAYQVTFKADELPPANAFWSITMYDASTQFLVENPINRYLINAPMLPELKRNADGSLTIYIQRDSPGKEKESNWLPAPNGPIYMVMRIYWPKTEAPSVLPPGKGTWKPPGIVPIANLRAERAERAERAKRVGDKSLENTIRTDDRYGSDPLFHGPRGYPYWNYLEYPKPIQNPNLWPDTQSTYFLARMNLPAGATLTFKGEYPRARYFKYALYRWNGQTFLSTGEDIDGKSIVPDDGSTNPFVVGNPRLGVQRNHTVRIVAADAPTNRERNTLYVGKEGGELQLVMRIYLSDQGQDGAGWGPTDQPSRARGLPSYEGTLADGTKLDTAGVIKHFALPMNENTKQPLNDQQWIDIVNAKDNDPTLNPATAPAREVPRWEKYWTLPYSILGAFKTPEARAKIPYEGAMDGGGDPSTQYMISFLSRKFGPVYVMRGKMPTFPDTFAGAGGRGLEIMPDAQTQYWSLVSCEAAPTGHIADGLTDLQIPLDADRNYTIVCSRKEDRPKNATLENGVAWLEWPERGEGLVDPRNRTDFAMLMLRIMANSPEWKERPDLITRPGDEEKVMGPYYPRGEYTTKAAFESRKLTK